MPKEYVYKLTLDDAEVRTTLKDLDGTLASLGAKYSKAFDGVGKSMGASVKKASSDAKKALNEAEQAQKRAEQTSSKLEKQYVRLFAAELKLAAGANKTTQEFIKQAAAGAQTGAALEKAVTGTTSLTNAQIQQASTTAQLKHQISEVVTAMSQEGADTEALTGQLQNLESVLSSVNSMKAEEAAAARSAAESRAAEAAAIESGQATMSAAQADATAEAEASDRVYKNLLASELQLAAGSDTLTKEFIKNTNASAATSESLLDAVSTTDRLSEAQIEHAQKIATVKARIKELTAALDEEGADREELVAQIKQQQGSLEQLENARQKEAARAQAVTNNLKKERDERKRLGNEAAAADKKAATAQRKAIAQNRKANREFLKLAKSFPLIKQGLVELTGQYGSFKTVIGQTGQATGNAQKHLHDLMKDNPKFAAEVRKLTKEYGNFIATVNRADFGPKLKSHDQAVRQLGFSLQRFGVQGTAAFGEIYAALGPVGIAIGALILPIIAITKAIKQLAGVATDAFKKMVKDSFEAAKSFETTEAAFKAIFKAAEPGVVGLALRRTREESERLGVTLEEILPKILPKVSSLEGAFKIAELIPGLAASAVDLGPSDALRSIIEALAGDLVSLRKAFEIDVTGIRKAQEEFGLVDGLVVGLNVELERMGLTFADQAETINVKIGQMEQKYQSFKLAVGAPIVDALKQQFAGLFSFLEANEGTLDNVATMIGEIIGNLAEDVGEGVLGFLEDIDPVDIERVANAIGSIADDIVKQAGVLTGDFEGVSSIADLAERVEVFFDKLDKGLTLLTQLRRLLGQADSVTAMFLGRGKLLSDVLGDIFGGVSDLRGAFNTFIRVLSMITSTMAGFTAGIRSLAGSLIPVITGIRSVEEAAARAAYAFRTTMLSGLTETQRQLEEYKEVTLEAVDVTEDLEGATDDAADASLNYANALRELANAEGDFIEKQQEINDKIREFAIDAEMRFEKMLTDLGRNMLKASTDNARKLIDIETKNRQKIGDVRDKFEGDVLDAAGDLNDREADILRKHGRKILDIEEDLNDDRLKAEQKYLDTLEKIRDKFNFDAFEAMLGNDAKRLAQLRRREAFEKKQAEKDRDRELRDVDDTAEDKRKELDKSLEYELQDARINNARKIRDLSKALQDSLAVQELARQREIESQATAEQRKQNDLRTSFQQQLDDYDIWWEERHRTTTEGIAEDLEEIRQWMIDRNELLDQINAVAGVAAQTPLEELRQQSMERFQQAQAAGAPPMPPGMQGQSLEELTGISQQELTEQAFAQYDRAQLEDIFNRASAQIGLPSLIQQRALDLFEQQAEAQDLHVTPRQREEQLERLQQLPLEELNTLIAELTAALAGIEIPEMPEGFEDLDISSVIPEGFSVPTVGAEPAPEPEPEPETTTIPEIVSTADQLAEMDREAQPTAIPEGFSVPTVSQPSADDLISSFFAAAGGVGGPPLAQPSGGYGFPPTLPADAAQFENFFLAGNLLPPSPAYGFDSEAYFDNLEDEQEAAAHAEMEKRGEIAETVSLAALLAEERASLHATLLDEEVAKSQTAGDAQIAIMEATLLKQQETLAAIRGDPALEVDVETLETSIGILEELIATAREEQAAEAERIAQQEVEAQVQAEADKVAEIEDTTAAVEEAYGQRGGIAGAGLADETDAVVAANQEQIAALSERFVEQDAMALEQRETELEDREEHEGEKQEQFAAAQEDMLRLSQGWWNEFLRLQAQGIINDLNMMQTWLQQRQIMYQQMMLTLPGQPGGGAVQPGDDDEPPEETTSGTNINTLRNLALDHIGTLGMDLEFWTGEVYAMTLEELQELILELQDMINAEGLELGGGATPGYRVVGERGPELVRFRGAARVDSFADMMQFSPPSRQVAGGDTYIDSSTNFGGFHMPYPGGLSPVEKQETLNLMAEFVKQSDRMP